LGSHTPGFSGSAFVALLQLEGDLAATAGE
jgi:hypothetical protein